MKYFYGCVDRGSKTDEITIFHDSEKWNIGIGKNEAIYDNQFI